MDGHFVQVLNQVLPGADDPGQGSRFLFAGGHPLLKHRGHQLHIAGRAFAIERRQGLALLWISHDDEVPILAIARRGSLQGKLQALADHLRLHRAREIQPLAHCARGGEQGIDGKIKDGHDGFPFFGLRD